VRPSTSSRRTANPDRRNLTHPGGRLSRPSAVIRSGECWSWDTNRPPERPIGADPVLSSCTSAFRTPRGTKVAIASPAFDTPGPGNHHGNRAEHTSAAGAPGRGSGFHQPRRVAERGGTGRAPPETVACRAVEFPFADASFTTSQLRNRLSSFSVRFNERPRGWSRVAVECVSGRNGRGISCRSEPM
jgi:hypothetical protein